MNEGISRGGNRSIRSDGWWDILNPWVFVLLGPLLLLAPELIRGEVLFWGTPLLQFIPWRTYGFEVLRHGELPLWNPLLGMGAPLLANYQSGFLYPLNGILFVVDLVWGHGLLVLIHLMLAALGMSTLAKRLGFRALSQFVAGLGYAMSAYLVGRAGFFSINAATAWLPWILWGLEGWIQADGWSTRDLLPLTAFLWLQWLSGHAQTSWYSLMFALAWLLWRFLSSDEGSSLGRFLRLLAPFGVAFLLAAPQLLPTLEYLMNSQRAAAVDPELALTYSFWPWRLLELVLPGIFGHPVSGDYWGYANYWEDALYFGTLPFVLAIGGMVASLKGRSSYWKLGRFLLIITTTSFLLGLGKNTPIFPWLMENVPTFNLFQAPTRWNLLVAASLPLLAAIGVEVWRPAEGRALYWLRLATAGAAAVSGGALLASQLLPDVRETFLLAFAFAGLWLLLAGLLGLLQRRQRALWWQLAVILVVIIDLLVANEGLIPTTERSLYEKDSQVSAQIDREHRSYIGPEAEYSYTFDRAFRFDSFSALEDWSEVRQVGLPNTLLLDGVSSANNFDPLLPARYQRWMEWLPSVPSHQRNRLLALMNVQQASFQLDGDGLPTYMAVAGPRRVRWLTDVKYAASGEQALQIMADPTFDPDQSLVLENRVEKPIEHEAEGRILSIEQISANSLSLEVAADGPGWLLLSDVYFPGWQARVDQTRVEIQQADYLFSAVHLAAGEHRVIFDYRPNSINIGFALFGLGSAIILGLFGRERWR